jgi:hypothetical protein
MSYANGPRIVTDGLVCCLDAANYKSYPGSGSTIYDLSGQNDNFNLVGSPAFNSSNGGSIDLESTVPSYLDRGSDKVYKTTGGWTVESWVNYETVANTYDNVNSPANFIGSDSISYNNWYWSVLSSKLALWNRSPGIWRYGSTTLQANTWYNAVLVCYDSGTSYQMYLNGVAEGGDHTTYSWNSSYAGLRIRYIGRGNSVNTRRLDGRVAITKIYTKALSANEVKQNYDALKGRYGLS